APAVQAQVKGEPLARQAAKTDTTARAKTESKDVTRAKKAADKFNQKVRRNIFIVLLVFTFLGMIVSIHRYVRSKDAPFGFGDATEIEVLAEGLNVHAENPKGKILGTIAKGSRHHVLEPHTNWLKIQVGDWNTKELWANSDEGWVYGDLDGNSPNVRVVSRK